MTLPATAPNTAPDPLWIDTVDGRMDVWAFLPQTVQGRCPLVILNTDIRGVRPVFLDYARALATAGYAVVVPNLYYRVAHPPVIDVSWTFAEARSQKRFAELLAGITADGLLRDHASLLQRLPDLIPVDSSQTAILGYCMSGAIALRVAGAFPEQIRAAMSFHGGHLVTDAPDSPHLGLSGIPARLFIGHASDDLWMTAAQIDRFETALSDANADAVSVTFAGRHGYAVADSPNYHADSARQHWAEIHALLSEALAAP
jgi:carboxymethylenebutenolidase